MWFVLQRAGWRGTIGRGCSDTLLSVPMTALTGKDLSESMQCFRTCSVLFSFCPYFNIK